MRLIDRAVLVIVWFASGLLYLVAMAAAYTRVVSFGKEITGAAGPWWPLVSDFTFVATIGFPAIWFLAPPAYWLFGGIVEEANKEVIRP